MKNVYLDPNSYVHINNVLFEKSDRYNTNNCRQPYIFLKEYCAEKGINLQTIDAWNAEVAREDDVYVSFDHKFELRKLLWRRRNTEYPEVDLKKFSQKILFHFEPPVVMPEIQFLIGAMFRLYDKVFFTWRIDKRKARYFHTPQAHDKLFEEYWGRGGRKFLTLIQSNRRPISRYKELLTERIRAILHFAKSKSIDVYGRDWDQRPPFPYWHKKGAIQEVNKGTVENKYKALSNYTFAFAYENCELPGYITDKIFDCFYVGTIPIYLGAPDVTDYIPENAFIHMRDFKDYEELQAYLKGLSEKQIQEYKENGRKFLESKQYKQFTKEHFAHLFVEAVQGA